MSAMNVHSTAPAAAMIIPKTKRYVKIFTYLFVVGMIMAAAGAVLWTFMALIYNLIADIVGGVEVVLAEKR